jgi:CubicO group peptidase (beta-lactamase class C family)
VQIHRFQGIITRVRKETIAALLLIVPLLKAADYFPPGDANGGWRTANDARKIRKVAGMDLAKLEEAFQFDQGTTQHGGLLVVRHGWLVYEKYFGRGNREANPDMASCGKAFTSIAVGIMLDEKRELIPNGLDEKVFTPQYMPANIFPLEDPAKADIKLGQLLAMSAGIRGTNPGYVHGRKVTLDPPAVDGPIATTDPVALHQPLWTKPGEGYSYATSSPHLASIVLRRLTGMEMQQYMEEKLAKPMQWGRWDYCMHRPSLAMDHTPGGGSIALRSTDALRFAHLLLHEGRWGRSQLVPAEYVRKCAKPSPYNPHYPFSLQFEVNEDGHVAGAPRDAFWKSGAGGFSIYAVPSLDLAIYKMGGNDRAYDPSLTGLPMVYKYDGSRDGWKPSGPVRDGGVRKLLEMVVAAVDK